MTDLLVKMFVKDYKEIKEPSVRQRYGIMSGIVGIICNIILCSGKLIAGFITGAVSIMADAINNLSDAGSSIITLIGFKLAGKPADSDHPYGHGRLEYIAGLIVSGIILVMAFELLKSSFIKVIHPEEVTFSLVSVIVLVASILVKMWMAAFNNKLGKRINSVAMLATATDSLSDCIATFVALASLLLNFLAGINLDGIAGCVVAIFVLKAGFDAAKDTLQPLLGQPPSKEYVEKLESIVLEDDNIIGLHDMMVHDYGPGRTYVSLHAEVSHNMDIMAAHDCIDMAERRVEEKMGCWISIHMDPVVDDDASVKELKEMTLEAIKNVGNEIRMHDFRTTQGPLITNLIFDIVIPYDYRLSDEEVVSRIKEEIKKKDSKCSAVIQVDKGYVGL